MYRLLVFLVVLTIADSHYFGKGNCPWKGRHGHNHKHDHKDSDEDDYHGWHGSSEEDYHGSQPPFGLHPNKPCSGPSANFPESTFEDIGKNMILIDNALKTFCDANNMNVTSELYGQDNYIVKYLLPGFQESDFQIKVTNRMVYTAANSKNSNVKAFKDLRLLPGTVDTTRASWVYEHKTLKVYFPYKSDSRNEEILYCDAVDETVKTVPHMGSTTSTPNFILRRNF